MTDKPEIDFIEGPAPTELQITDLIEGDGAEAVGSSTLRGTAASPPTSRCRS